MRRVLVLAVLALLLGATRAAAAQPDTTVDFERVPNGTAVTTQYVSPEGVEFGDPTEFGLPAFGLSCGVTARSGGIAGRSGQMACQAGGGGDVTNPTLYNAAFEFRETRRKVGFQLRNTTPDSDGRESATVRFYGPAGQSQLLNEQTITFPSASTTRDVSWEITGSTRIASVWVKSVDSIERLKDDNPPVYIDNIYAAKDDVPPDPQFALALQTPSVSLYEGSTANATLSIRRFNGSTGAVNLGLTGGFPAGVTGVQFTPPTVTGRDPVIMKISAGLPFSGSRQLSVHATGASPDAGTAANGDLIQTVVGQPALTIGNQGAATLVRGCGSQTVQDAFTVRGGFTGDVRVGPTGTITGPASIAVPTPHVSVGGNGTYPFTLLLGPDGSPASPGNGGTYSVRATPNDGVSDGTTVTANRSYTITDMSADSATSPSGGAIARPLKKLGPQAVVTGSFPRQCEIEFVDQHDQVWPIVDRHTVEVGGRARDQITLQVPLLSTSGPLTVKSVKTGKALTATPPLDIIDFRNVNGSAAANSDMNAGAPDYNWEDFRRTFGNDDVDRCFLGMCGRDSVAENYHQKYLADVKGYNGLCAGFVFMAMRFSGFHGVVQRPSDYEPGRKRAWQISNFADGTLWKRDLVRWYVAQDDASFSKARDEAIARSADAERNLLRKVINSGSVAYVSIKHLEDDKTTSGHAVIAYAIDENVPARPGEVAPVTLVRLYDPNLPYGTKDEKTPNSATSAEDAATFRDLRTIRIDANGAWSGANFPWSGTNSQLGVIDAIPSDNATLPTKSFLIVFTVDSKAATPKLVDLEYDGKDALTPQGQPKAGSGVTTEPLDTGGPAEPRYGLKPGHTYTATFRGTGKSKYVQGQYARHAVATVETTTKKGQVDKLTLKPRSPVISFSTGAAKARVEYKLAENAGRAGRGAVIATTAAKGHKDKASLGGGGITLNHSGPATTATLTLSSTGEGLPVTVTTTPIRVGAGQQLKVNPKRWSDLGAGAKYTIRSPKGKVIRHGRVRLRKSRTVSLKRVKARLKGRTVTVSGRIGKTGKSPALVAEAVFTRHGKVVARKGGTVRGKKAKSKRFKLRIRLPRAPEGARGQATVMLTDEATDTPGARRTTRIGG